MPASTTESPCALTTRLRREHGLPSDQYWVGRRSRILGARCPNSPDPERCAREYEAAWRQITTEHPDYYTMPLDRARALKKRWWAVADRAEEARIEVAGPGTLLARWIRLLFAVLTLGVVTIRPCPACEGRKNKLDQMGWGGLARALVPRLRHGPGAWWGHVSPWATRRREDR